MRQYQILLLQILFVVSLCTYVLPHKSSAQEEFNLVSSESTKHQHLEHMLDYAWSVRNSLPDTALYYSLKAIVLADSLENQYNHVKAHSFAGVSYRLLGNYSQAIEYFFRGLSLAKEYQIPQQEAYAYINIANLYIYLEYYNQALENLHFAREIAAEVQDERILSYVYLNTGRALMHSNRFDEAIENLQYALELRKEKGNVPGQAVCYKYLGDIHFNRNQTSRATENYQLALEVINKSSDRHLLGNIYLQLSLLNSREKNWPDARRDASRALEIGKEVNSRLIIHDALKVLSEVDLAQENFREAAQMLAMVNEYADTLYNQQLAEKVLSVEFQWEREKRQAELDILERDKEIQQLRLERQKALNNLLLVISILILAVGIILYVLLQKLRSQNVVLQQQKEELRQLNQAKDKMFMVIGHDLRGPAWNIKALIELILDEDSVKDNPDLSESINLLSRSTQALTDLLENLLFWAKTQDGKLVFKPTRFSINQLTENTIKLYRPWANLKNLSIDCSSDTQIELEADENMISTVLRNLLSNAIKFSHKGGKIDIQLSRQNGVMHFSIKDNGIGIDSEKLPFIFHDEQTLSTRGTGNETGSGIGLGLSKDFIEKHGGRIWAESKPKAGTEFHFTLPVSPDKS